MKPFSKRRFSRPRSITKTALVKDTEELRRALADAQEQQTATADILRLIASSPADLQAVLDAVAERAARLCEATDVLIHRVDGHMLPIAASAGAFGATYSPGEGFPITRGSVVGRAVMERKTIHIHDLAAESDDEFPVAKEFQRRHGHRTVLATPLMRAGVPLGAIWIRRTEVRPFTDKQIKLLETFADQAVVAIENVRLFTELQEKNRELTQAHAQVSEALEQQTATGGILRVLSGSPTDVQPVFDTILDSATRLCAAENGILFQYDDGAFHTVACRGLSPEAETAFRAHPARPGPHTGLGRMLAEQRPVQVADVTDDIAYRQGDPLRARTVTLLGARTAMWLPLLKRDAVVGALAIYRRHVRPFTAKQIELVGTFADQAVIAIENVRLFNETKEALEQQTATAEILQVIASSPTSIQSTFEAIAKAATTLCEADLSGLYPFDGDLIHFGAQDGRTQQEIDAARQAFPQPLNRLSVTARAILASAVVQVADVSEDPEIADTLRIYRTVLSVPMLRDDRPVGAITVARRVVRAFSDKQIALLQTFADQAVIAIENVRLFTELQEKNEALTQAHAQVSEALEQQTATAEILRVIAGSPTDVQPVFEAIVRSAVALCGGLYGAVYRRFGDVVDCAALYGLDPDAQSYVRRNFPRPITAGRARHFQRALLDGTVVSIADIAEEPGVSSQTREFYLSHEGRSVVLVPLIQRGEILGVLGVGHRNIAAFSDRHVNLLQTFADQAVIAIENVRLFTELQEKNRALTEAHAQVTEALEQQTATSEILRVISSSPTAVQPVFESLVASAARLCGANDLLLLIREADVLRPAAGVGSFWESLAEEFRVPLVRGTVAARSVIDGATLHVADLGTMPEAEFPVGRDLQRRFGHHTVLAVPLMREGVALGTIFAMRFEVRPFVDQQISLLQTFADQAVIAIENVRLFKELEARNTDLTEALEQQTATAEILRVISSSPTDLQPVLVTVAENAARVCGAVDAQIYRVEGESLHWVASHGPIPPNTEERLISRGWVTGRAVVDRRTIHVHDLAAESDTEYPVGKAAQRQTGHRTTLSTPLLREGVPLGVISIRRMEVRPFSEKQVRLLQTFADQAVIAIENVRLFKELEEKNRALTEAHTQVTETLEQQTATGEILRTIAHAQSEVQPVFDTIARSATRLCRAAMAAVFLSDGRMVDHAADYGSSPEALAAARTGYPRPLDMETTPGTAILTRSIVHVPDIEEPSARVHVRQIGRVVGFRSVVSVPMLREGEAVGAISVARREPGRFSDAEVELLKTFADQAVIAVENVRLFKELEARTAALTRSVEQLTALGEVGRAVSSTLDLGMVLTTIVSRAVQLSGLDGGVLFEYDENTEEFVQRVATETGAALAEARRTTRIRKGEGVLGQTAITLEPVQVPDITVPGAYAGRLRETLIESGVRAILAVPMVREGQIIGCLGVTRNRPGEFPAETIELLRTFATQSALAIQNARLFQEIEDKSRQLEAASRHKSEFLANMSHELRTPLNAVIGFSEVLIQRMFGALNDKQDEYLKDIYASGQHLLSLINDILDLSKIEAGRMELVLAPFHLPTALENAVTLVRERAGRHGIALHLDLDPRLDQLVGDERKVKQVLLNLLSNAVKFTPEGGQISLKASRRDGAVEVAVTDTGIGIAPEDQAAIFEEFRQVGSDETRKQEGTGLGLTLAKKFVELHGGRIWVESEPGRGSTFTFTLPVS